MNMDQIREAVAGWLERLPFFRKNEEQDPVTHYLIWTLLITAVISVIAYGVFNRTHLFKNYEIESSIEINDTEGTQYVKLGKRIIKYSHDGVFCVNNSNDMLWSAAYSMQAPIYDICGNTMVIAEERGTLVYIINDKGIIGNFETPYPILGARTSAKGVVALLLEDGDVTWVSLYDAAGNAVASVKTTMADSGYPLDIALSENAKKMVVSLVSLENGGITGKLNFYDFSSAQASDESHMIGSVSYEDCVFPSVYFPSSSSVAAVTNKGYTMFSVGRKVSEKNKVEFEDEIVSTFHDDEHIGFVFHSDEMDVRYRMEVYNYLGKRMMKSEFDFDYAKIALVDGEVMLFDGSRLCVFRPSGRQKIDILYEKEVRYFGKLSGYRKYQIISNNSIDRIRVS